jgi:hypothetical protein
MTPLLLLVRPDDLHQGKAAEAEACEVALSPISVTMDDMDDMDEKSMFMQDEDTIMTFHDEDDEAVFSSDVPDTDFNDISTSCSRMVSDDECSASAAAMDTEEEEEGVPPYCFWVIPPELRTMIYENLLLSDSAFRLGHHGPYSHEQRRELYPEILRTCSTIFEEASDVLYGNNTFYLGMTLNNNLSPPIADNRVKQDRSATNPPTLPHSLLV